MNYFVTGIGTGIGKTIACAIVAEALQADYWKPIQCGVDDVTGKTDLQVVKELVSNSKTVIHPETYFLKAPMSPHAAAKLEGVKIDINTIQLPKTENNLIIEGAGGLMVPLNETHLMIDLIEQLKAQVIVVSQTYLGGINHTLLTCAELNRRNIPVAGIIFNGDRNEESEQAILSFSGLNVFGRIPTLKTTSKEKILQCSENLKLEILN